MGAWSDIPALSPFILADGSSLAKQQTQVRLAYNAEALFVRFDCDDDDIWGTFTERDDPLYDEEVVEIFIAFGEESPTRYFEFEVSPHGVLFDCTAFNPSGHPDEHFAINKDWNASGLEWTAEHYPEKNHWWALLKLPWQDIGGFHRGGVHEVWRANFYRIERSRKSESEFSCWSPVWAERFHTPARFGTLTLAKN